MTKPSFSAQLLDAIPEHLRDVPNDGLLGRTPRQVVDDGHVEFAPGGPGCMACREVLKGLAQ